MNPYVLTPEQTALLNQIEDAFEMQWPWEQTDASITRRVLRALEEHFIAQNKVGDAEPPKKMTRARQQVLLENLTAQIAFIQAAAHEAQRHPERDDPAELSRILQAIQQAAAKSTRYCGELT